MLRDLSCIEKAEFSSSLQCKETSSLGPGSAMGEKGKKRDQMGKNQIGDREQSAGGDLEKLVISKLHCAGIVLINYQRIN